MVQDLSSLNFVAFDTETTGLYPASEGLVEIAAVRFDLKVGALEYFQTLVNPGKSIPWEATRVHGITDEMVFEAPKFEAVLPSFYQFIEGAVPVAHNAPFDLGFITLHSLRAGIAPPATMPVLDSCMFSRRAFPEIPSHRLSALVEHFEINSGTFHRALADAKSCMEVFRILVGKTCGLNASWDELLAVHGKTHSFQETSRPMESSSKAKKQEIFEPLHAAMQAKKSVWINYEGSYGPREVSPLLLYAKGSQEYLEATCHLDGTRKSFRLDRIKKIYSQGEVSL